MIISFVFFLALFVVIGLSSYFKSQNTASDYYIAGGTLPPWLVGLSAVATNNSGYMFIGVIGYTYATGLASVWLMIGWILGDLAGSLLIHRRFIQVVKQSGEVSFAGVMSVWFQEGRRPLDVLIAIISVIFLLAYTSAQLVAGSKALHVLLSWPMWSGAVIGAVLVALYCMAGGIRASIWTDAAQSFVMMVAMALLLVVAVSGLGGTGSAILQLESVDGFMDWNPKDLVVDGILGVLLFVLGWFFAGLSTLAQPHIMVRFMALNKVENLVRARVWYYAWFIIFYCLATAVGLLSRVYLPDTGTFDAELALPSMAMNLLPGIFVGLILAGIFAATMSTADSLVMSCSAAISQDLLKGKINSKIGLTITTVLIVVFALAWALVGEGSVFQLVIFAWSGLASAFGPLLITLCFGYRPKVSAAVSAIVIGLVVAVAWRVLGWHGWIYEGLPAMSCGFGILMFYHLMDLRRERKA